MKQIIRLTEGDLHDIIRESVRSYINEGTNDCNILDRTFITYGEDKYDASRIYNVQVAGPKAGKKLEWYRISNTKDGEKLMKIYGGSLLKDGIDVNDFKDEKAMLNLSMAIARNKPSGGLWASPVDTKNGWIDFAATGFSNFTPDKHILFRLKKNAKIYTIKDKEDIIAISNVKNQFGGYCMNIQSLIDEGYDGIYAENIIRNEIESPGDGWIEGMSSWDVDSICIWNLDIVEPIDESDEERDNKVKQDWEKVNNLRKDDPYSTMSDEDWQAEMEKQWGKYEE